LRERPIAISAKAVGHPAKLNFGDCFAYGTSRARPTPVLSKLLKALIDPSAAPVRALSREQRELMIAANNSYRLAFDNLSDLPHLALRSPL
jgi:hypothetical protein